MTKRDVDKTLTPGTLARLMLAGSFAGLLSVSSGYAMTPNPKERIDFWRDNYTSLQAEQEPRVAKAQTIFQQLINAAGHRRGIEPRLLIIKEDPNNLSLPISIPDGWIILSRAVLDICYENSEAGDTRLAFVLAHELAHQLEDDFWHMKFFQALDAARSHSKVAGRVYAEVQAIARQSDKILAKELRADELGIVYVTMAGFDSHEIVTDTGQGNFFQQWNQARQPLRYASHQTLKTHPDIRQRTAAVRARLQQVTEQSELFKLGLWFFHSGDYARAIQSFDEFRRYFPGRAVHHNLASSYHRLAMRFYHTLNRQPQLQFQLSMLVDPESRASHAAVRGNTQGDGLFHRYMQQAVHYYQLALEQDPDYLFTYHNLSAAWLHLDEAYKAIAVLQDGLQRKADDPGLLNNLGVAFYLAGNLSKAQQYLDQAQEQAEQFGMPLYNLGVMAWRNGDEAQAQHYWQAYLDLRPDKLWANYLTQHARLDLRYHPLRSPKHNREQIQQLQVGNYTNEVSKAWQVKTTSQFKLHNCQYQGKLAD